MSYKVPRKTVSFLSVFLATSAWAESSPQKPLGISNPTCKPNTEKPSCLSEKNELVLIPSSFSEKPAIGTKAKCAVTGEEFTVDASTLTSTYKGRIYVFCCPGCKGNFDKDPSKYITGK